MSPSPRLRLVPSAAEPASSTVTVVTQATVQGRQPATVRALYPVRSGAGQQIAVRVGPILILVADRAALDSFVSAWRQAEGLADGAFAG